MTRHDGAARGSGSTGWLARYLDHLASERGLSPNTLAAYRQDIEARARSIHDSN